MSIKIKAIEKQLPNKRIHSSEMDQLANGKVGRIEKHTGVEYRHHISGKESVCSLGAEALLKALETAQMNLSEIDLLIFSGASFDYPIPHNAAIIKSLVADDSIHFNCIDINSTCLSFLNALDIANMYLESNRYKSIALVCSEVSSRALTPKEEMVFGLFGDAAVALIIEKSETSGYRQTYADFINYPSGSLMAHVPIGGAINRGIHSEASDLGYYFKMNGKGLFRLATRHLDSLFERLENHLNMKLDDFDAIIPHQTSKMGNEYFLNHFKVRQEQVVETLSAYGNCISASIPLGLEKYYKQEKAATKQNILLFGSGAGVSLGAVVLSFE
jgi:3-oxoacyl-[acyl-carrier-protein] synthase-3